jgi:hypothetical protein
VLKKLQARIEELECQLEKCMHKCVSYYATLTPGTIFNDDTKRSIEKCIEDNKDLIFDYDPKGRHKNNEIDLKSLLNIARDIK